MKDLSAWKAPTHMRFGIEQRCLEGEEHARSRLVIDLATHIYERFLEALPGGLFARLMHDGVMEVQDKDSLTNRLRLLHSPWLNGNLMPADKRFEVTEKRAHAVAGILKTLQRTTSDTERDPMLDIRMPSSVRGNNRYGMDARLTIPNQVNLSPVAEEALKHMQQVAASIGYMPVATNLGVTETPNRLRGIWVGGYPAKGLRVTRWEMAERSDFMTMRLIDNGLTSHTQQFIALAGLVGIVETVRQQAATMPDYLGGS